MICNWLFWGAACWTHQKLEGIYRQHGYQQLPLLPLTPVRMVQLRGAVRKMPLDVFFSSFCPDGLWKKYILCAFSSLKRINDPRASDWRTTQHVFRGQATGFSCEIWRTKTKTDPSGTSKELIASGYSFLDSQKRSGRALRSYDWFIIYIQPRPTVDTSTITPSYCILVSSQHCWIGWSDYPLQIIFEGTMGSPISTLLQVSTFNGSQFAANPLIIIDYPWLANIYI